MRILFVSHCHPWPLDSGVYQRVYHLVEGLARRHQVTLVLPASRRRPNHASGNGFSLGAECQRIIEVDTYPSISESVLQFHHWAPVSHRLQALMSSPLPCVVRQQMSTKMREVLEEIRRRETFDVVWAERPSMGEIARAAGFEKILVDMDDIESVSLARFLKHSAWYRSKPLHYAELAKLYFYERLLPRRFWRLVVCKEQDRRLFGRECRNIFTVPNGVASFQETPCETERAGEMLFVGTLSYVPNIDAVQFFHESIFPKIRRLAPNASLTIVGKEPERAILDLHDGSTCVVKGEVTDLTPHFASASLVVAPIRLGSGTRIKVLEALARGKAVVATSTAAEGLNLRPGIDLEIADSPEAFTGACVRLLADPAARRRLGAAGRLRVRELYHWGAIAGYAELAVAPAGATGSAKILADATCDGRHSS